MTAREMQVSVMDYVMAELSLNNSDRLPTQLIFDVLNKYQFEFFFREIMGKEDENIELRFNADFTEEFGLRNPVDKGNHTYDYKLPGFTLEGGTHSITEISSSLFELNSDGSSYLTEVLVGDKLYADGVYFGDVTQINSNISLYFKPKYSLAETLLINTSTVQVGSKFIKQKEVFATIETKGCIARHSPIRIKSTQNISHYLNDVFQRPNERALIGIFPDTETLRVFFKGGSSISEEKLIYIRKPLDIKIVLGSTMLLDRANSQDCELDSLYHPSIVNQAGMELTRILKTQLQTDILNN